MWYRGGVGSAIDRDAAHFNQLVPVPRNIDNESHPYGQKISRCCPARGTIPHRPAIPGPARVDLPRVASL